jgi:hypothetical protein
MAVCRKGLSNGPPEYLINGKLKSKTIQTTSTTITQPGQDVKNLEFMNASHKIGDSNIRNTKVHYILRKWAHPKPEGVKPLQE